MNDYIPVSGSGAPKQLPQEVMFVITDGMRHESREDHNPDFQFDATKCEPLKNRGVRLGIVNTGYASDLCSEKNPRCPPKLDLHTLYLEDPLIKCASKRTLCQSA